MTGLRDRADGPDKQVPQQVQARWRQGEEQLYAAALSRADAYERSVDLVRRTAEHLRGLGAGPEPLLAAGERGAGLVVEALGGRAAAGVPVDLDLVAQAALALRHREVVAEQAARQRARSLRGARGRGEAWVVLEESGEAEGSPLVPYRRLEADACTGRAVLVTTAPDPSFASTLHAVEGLVVDLATGALRELRDSCASSTTHPGAVQREHRAAALRKALSEL